jgi:hypothetical protein
MHCAHEIPMAADAFWAMIHSPAYEAAAARAAGLGGYREVERREEPDAVYRRLEVEAALPGALGRLLRGAGVDGPLRYVEEQWRSRTHREVRWRMTPSLLGDRARIEGVVRVEPTAPDRCRRVLDGVMELRLPGVAGWAERAAVKRVTDAYARGAEVAARLGAPG